MKERPMLFNDAMVRAILEGQKTQTRRVVNRIASKGPVTEFQRSTSPGYDWIMRDRRMLWNDYTHAELLSRCPHGQIDDRMWVREAWSPVQMCWIENGVEHTSDFAYRATGDVIGCHKWKPSIHMPRQASRITLEITGVRVERLQDISEQDAIAEGLKAVTKDGGRTIKYGIPDKDGLPGADDDGWEWRDWQVDPRQAYRHLWEVLYGPGSWDANPWVWVIEFQ